MTRSGYSRSQQATAVVIWTAVGTRPWCCVPRNVASLCGAAVMAFCLTESLAVQPAELSLQRLHSVKRKHPWKHLCAGSTF